MHLTRYTDYSLRVLIYIALKDEQISTVGEIATSYGISRNHLMKVVQALNNNGYLIAVRGKNGGLRLNGPPEKINVGALVRETEQALTLVDCFSGGAGCVITPACHLKNIFAEALEGFFRTLDQYTLADLLPARNQKKLLSILQIAP